MKKRYLKCCLIAHVRTNFDIYVFTGSVLNMSFIVSSYFNTKFAIAYSNVSK